jgi:hypothetical protein
MHALAWTRAVLDNRIVSSVDVSFSGNISIPGDNKSNFVNSMRLLIAGNQIDCPHDRQFTERL